MVIGFVVDGFEVIEIDIDDCWLFFVCGVFSCGIFNEIIEILMIGEIRQVVLFGCEVSVLFVIGCLVAEVVYMQLKELECD